MQRICMGQVSYNTKQISLVFEIHLGDTTKIYN